MKKEDVYRIALICFNVDYDKIMPEEVEGQEPELPNEVLLCERFYRAAELFCIESYDWSFMHHLKRYEDKDLVKELSSPEVADGKDICYQPPLLHCHDFPCLPEYDYAYEAPSDMAKPLFVNGSHNATIKRIGNTLIFNVKNPALVYIGNSIDYNHDEDYPDDFFYMIAYRLAMEIQPNIQADNNTILASITTRMQSAFQALRQADMTTTRIKTPPADFFVL